MLNALGFIYAFKEYYLLNWLLLSISHAIFNAFKLGRSPYIYINIVYHQYDHILFNRYCIPIFSFCLFFTAFDLPIYPRSLVYYNLFYVTLTKNISMIDKFITFKIIVH